VRGLLRERLARRKKRVDPYLVAQELGAIGNDHDPRKGVARKHSAYLRATLRGKRHPLTLARW
jgi:hypothetical protein